MIWAGPRQLPSTLLLALVPGVFLSVVLIAPVARLLVEGGAGALQGMLLALWQDDYLRWRMQWSFLQAFITCAAALVLGVPVAWVLARYEFAGRKIVLQVLMLPFVVPTLVAAMGVLALLGPKSLAAQWLGFGLQDTAWLLLYGNLFFNLCVLIRSGVDGLGQVSASQVLAARSLGATPWRVFWRVEWPALMPWLMSALCLVFLYCFSGFGLALILGGQQFGTIEVEIYTLVAHELKLAEAGALAVIVLIFTGGIALIYAAIEKNLATPARVDSIERRRPKGAWQWVFVAFSFSVLLVFCAAPLLAILVRVVRAGSASWAVVLEPETLAALWNTVRFSGAALVLATLLGLTHAVAARQSVWLRASAFLPFVVSPVTVAFGLLLLYPRWTASLALLVAAYALVAYPFVVKSLGSALDSLPANLGQVARSLGAPPWRVFLRVTLPLVMPALRRGMAFAAATALGEFAVSLFLSRPEWTTLTTLIYQRLGRPGETNLDAALVLACLLMVLALGAFWIIENAFAGRGRIRQEESYAQRPLPRANHA